MSKLLFVGILLVKIADRNVCKFLKFKKSQKISTQYNYIHEFIELPHCILFLKSHGTVKQMASYVHETQYFQKYDSSRSHYISQKRSL